MEAALVTIVVALIGWILYHSSQCADVHERLAKLEQWKRDLESK